MVFFRILTVLCIGIAFLLSCTRGVEREVVDYQNDKSIKLPEWECHQVYSIRPDSSGEGSFLEVVAFPKKKYPGFSMGWLNGDWTRFASLRIIARTRGKGPVRFSLTVWDGKGTYSVQNRFQKEFLLDTGWTLCELPIHAGMVKPNGEETDVRHITKVVFLTGNQASRTVFDIKKIQLQR